MSFLKKLKKGVEHAVGEAQKFEQSARATLAKEPTFQNRYGATFHPTEGNQIKWFVDGKDYFHALSEALEAATSNIALIGWWVTPELYLRRPPWNEENRKWRLDRVLSRAATERGVHVYGVVYDDVPFVSSNDSAHTVEVLQAVNPKMIKIMRHPDHTKISNIEDAFYWSHHDKAMMIDNKIVFWGGLDSCFGRWDYNVHPLADLHANLSDELWVGQDYNDARLMDFSDVQHWKANMLNRSEAPRMPWHDVSMCVTGPLVQSFYDHFIQRWNFVRKDILIDEFVYPKLDPNSPVLKPATGDSTSQVVHEKVVPLGHMIADRLNLGPTPTAPATPGIRAQLCRSASKWSQGVPTEKSIQNAYISLIENAEHFIYIENQFFVTATKEHIADGIFDGNPIKNQIGRALVSRILRSATRGENFKVIVFMPAVPGFAEASMKTGDETAGTKAIMEYQYMSICRGGTSIMEELQKHGVKNPGQYISFFNLRSFDRIALTPQRLQHLQDAGLDVVSADVTLDMKVNGHIKNQHVSNVQVVQTPNGDLQGNVVHTPEKTSLATSLQEMFNLRKTASAQDVNNAVESAWNKLTGAGKKPSMVSPTIAQHGLMTGKQVSSEVWVGDQQDAIKNFVTEELYIHTKLMIVDDKIVICGSANLNDRSQQGDRDSEVAVVIEDTTMRPSKMNGMPYQVSEFAASLRRRLMREHLGLLAAENFDTVTANSLPLPTQNVYDWGSKEDYLVEDPLSADFWQLLTTTAHNNTQVFWNIFRALPSDYVKSTKDFDHYVTNTMVDHVYTYDPSKLSFNAVVQSLSTIRGHVVEMPLQYLSEEKLITSELTKLTANIYT